MSNDQHPTANAANAVSKAIEVLLRSQCLDPNNKTLATAITSLITASFNYGIAAALLNSVVHTNQPSGVIEPKPELGTNATLTKNV